MTDLQRGIVAATDAALISRARLGNRRAYDALAARHRPAMRTLAVLLQDEAPDLLVDDALDAAYRSLRRMAGPRSAIRTFLLLLTRRLTEVPAGTEPAASDDLPFLDHRGSELHAAVGAGFARLPEAWQAAVWHLEAEREPLAQVASVLGVVPAGVRRLVTSARQELRTSLLRDQQGRLPPACAGHVLRLARARGAVPPRSVLRHAAGCERCVVLVADLDIVERELAGTLARHLLGPAADGYLDLRRQRSTVG